MMNVEFNIQFEATASTQALLAARELSATYQPFL